jgi:hypothetical protein
MTSPTNLSPNTANANGDQLTLQHTNGKKNTIRKRNVQVLTVDRSFQSLDNPLETVTTVNLGVGRLLLALLQLQRQHRPCCGRPRHCNTHHQSLLHPALSLPNTTSITRPAADSIASQPVGPSSATCFRGPGIGRGEDDAHARRRQEETVQRRIHQYA